MPTAVDDNGPPSTPPRLSGTKRALRDAVGPAGDVADRADAVDVLLLFRKDCDDSGGNVISLDPSTASAAAASAPMDASVVVKKRSLPPSRAPRLPHHRFPMTKIGPIAAKIRSPACVPPSSPRSMIDVAAVVIIPTSSTTAVDDGPSPLSVLPKVFEDQPPL